MLSMKIWAGTKRLFGFEKASAYKRAIQAEIKNLRLINDYAMNVICNLK